MTRLLDLNRKKISFACCVVSLLLAMTVVLSVRTNSQHLNQKAKNHVLEQIENLVDKPLSVVGNDDCPVRIVEAKVKEVSGSQFTKLTNKMTDLVTVSSVPEIELINTSGKSITGFVVAIRDPQLRITRTFAQRNVSIAPGETYVVKREHFVAPERVTVASENGEVRQTLVQPRLDSEKYWLQFAGRSDVFITVGHVSFDDGSRWKIKEGGEVSRNFVKKIAYVQCGAVCAMLCATRCEGTCYDCTMSECLDKTIQCCEEAARETGPLPACGPDGS